MKTTALGELGERLLLNGSGAQLNSVDHRRVQNVDTGVDAVADESLRLLNETVNLRRLRLVHNHTIFARVLDLRGNNSSLAAVSLVERSKILERVVADNVRVQHKEGAVILRKNLLSKLERTSSAQRLGLDAEADVDAVDLLVLLQRLDHDFRAVVHGEYDVRDTGIGESLNLVKDHRAVRELNEGLRRRQGKRAQTSTVATDENQTFHFCSCV